MYPFERYLCTLKQSIGNKARVEGSIKNAYLVKETTTFCSYYFGEDIAEEFRTVERNNDGVGLAEGMDSDDLSIFTFYGRVVGAASRRMLSDSEMHTMHTYVLSNCLEVQFLVRGFIDSFVRRRFLNISPDEEQKIIESDFRHWLRALANRPEGQDIDPRLKSLAEGPSRATKSYTSYIYKGYRFSSSAHSSTRRTSNSGVCVRGATRGGNERDYFGVIDEIIMLEYSGSTVKQVILFSCDWYDTATFAGFRTMPRLNIVEVNKMRRLRTEDKFMLVAQIEQIYYLPYPHWRREQSDWLVVCRTNPSSPSELLCEQYQRESMAFQESQQEAHIHYGDQDLQSLAGPLNDPTETFFEPPGEDAGESDYADSFPDDTFEEDTEDTEGSNGEELNFND